MRVMSIVSFLVLFVVWVPLFAQPGGGSNATSTQISTDFGSSYGGVENVSAASAGTFIGGGRPTVGFVGREEIYSSSSNRSTASSRSRVTTTTARSVTSMAARRTTANTGRTTLGTGANNQVIRSATSIDFDFVMPSSRMQPATVETHLNRVYGIQDSQVAFTSSPQGTTAVLTGTVASDRERRVAQQLLLMEPGINRVENLLDLR